MPLIYGLTFGYNWISIRLFVISLRKSGYKGDLLLGISCNNSKKIIQQMKKYKVKYILLDDEWPFYSHNNLYYFINKSELEQCSIKNKYYRYKWNVIRFSILNCWLSKYGKNYTHIISLDVRDVVFQGNPFNWNFKDGVYLVEETKDAVLIKDDNLNLHWIKVYKNYKDVMGNRILNSGTILGSFNYFDKFIKQFCQFLKDNYSQTSDQGTLNYAFYSGYFNNITFIINRNQFGVVLTTGLDLHQVLKLKIINSTIYNKDLTIPYIVHQYDRSYKLRSMYERTFLMNFSISY